MHMGVKKFVAPPIVDEATPDREGARSNRYAGGYAPGAWRKLSSLTQGRPL